MTEENGMEAFDRALQRLWLIIGVIEKQEHRETAARVLENISAELRTESEALRTYAQQRELKEELAKAKRFNPGDGDWCSLCDKPQFVNEAGDHECYNYVDLHAIRRKLEAQLSAAREALEEIRKAAELRIGDHITFRRIERLAWAALRELCACHCPHPWCGRPMPCPDHPKATPDAEK